MGEELSVCTNNLKVTHLYHSDLLHKTFGSRQSEQTDSSQLEEADIQPNTGVEQSTSQLEQAASQPNTCMQV